MASGSNESPGSKLQGEAGASYQDYLVRKGEENGRE